MGWASDGARVIELSRILCAVDLDDASRPALEQAIALAAGARGTVEVLHVVADSAGDASRLRAWIARSEAAHGEVRIEAHVASGPAAATIAQHAERLGCHAIAVGTHGREGLARALLGSVSEAVIRAASVPVLVVPATQRVPRRLRAILCPVDLTEISGRALAESAALAQSLDAVVHAVHCWQIDGTATSADMRHELEALVRRHASRGPTVARHLRHGPAHEEIAEVAAELGVDLVVCATHGRRGLDRLVEVSIAERVARTSAVPVLVIRV